MAEEKSGRDEFVSFTCSLLAMFAGLCHVHGPQADAGPALRELIVQDLATMEQQEVL